MAIYHLHVKTFTRSKGQSATAAAAYRAGDKILDGRTGQLHDYTHKRGIVSSELVLPKRDVPEWAKTREGLWSKAESVETRKNSTVAREFEVALPSELTQDQRRELAVHFAKELVRKHGFAAEVSIHKPSRQGDERNHHAHILVTTRKLEARGFTEKTRELDDRYHKGPQEIERWRERWAQLQNQYLERHRHKDRVDHRTLKAQGIDRAPTQHKGPHATAIERKSHQPSRIENDQRQYETTPQERQEQQQRREIAENRATMVAEGRRIRGEMAREQRREQLVEQERKSREAEQERKRLEQVRAQMRVEAEALRQRELQFLKKEAERARERAQHPRAPEPTAPPRAPEPSREPAVEPAPYKPMSMEEGLAASQARFEERARQKVEQERREQQEREEKERLRLEKQRLDRERHRNRGDRER